MAIVWPLESVDRTVNGHRFYADRWPGSGWVILCDSYPDLAENYDGASDISPALDLFEARATAAGADGTLKESA